MKRKERIRSFLLSSGDVYKSTARLRCCAAFASLTGIRVPAVLHTASRSFLLSSGDVYKSTALQRCCAAFASLTGIRVPAVLHTASRSFLLSSGDVYKSTALLRCCAAFASLTGIRVPAVFHTASRSFLLSFRERKLPGPQAARKFLLRNWTYTLKKLLHLSGNDCMIIDAVT